MYLATEIMQAHAGGWDETLIIAGPLLVIAALVHKSRNNRPPDEQPDANSESRRDGALGKDVS